MDDDELDYTPPRSRSEVDLNGWLAVAIAFGAGLLTSFIIMR